MSTRGKLLVPLVAWTLVVWIGRLRNVWTDDDLTPLGRGLRTALAAVFLTFATAMAWRLWQRRGDAFTRGDLALLAAFVGWTIGVWLVRGVGIIVDDHDAGFTAVHTVLMVVSIGLALNAARLLGASAGSVSSPAASAR